MSTSSNPVVVPESEVEKIVVRMIVHSAVLISIAGCQTTSDTAFRPTSPYPTTLRTSVTAAPPVRAEHIAIESPLIPIGRDPSHLVVEALGRTQETPTARLLRPGLRSEDDGLWLLEPYQPGKIPIVFVHGLNSDRSTWARMTNELRAIPWVNFHFQFWYFQYPTGEPFLRSALSLREQTRAAITHFAEQHQDPMLSRVVLIGHSMGGLISKLQVTHSSNTIWQGAANRPFTVIRGEPQYLDQLWRLFFFDPQPFVERVVFIGTPHRGSAWASQMVGRLAANMVQQPADRQEMHRSLIAANPGVFLADFRRRIPTSVDLLEPASPLLSAMSCLQVDRRVRLHSIIGMRQGHLFQPSDGVVSVESARHRGVASERFVNGRHSRLTQHPETLQEVLRILAEHIREGDFSGRGITVPQTLPDHVTRQQ